MAIETRPGRAEERTEVSDLVNLAFEKQLCAPGAVGSSDDDPHDRPENTRVLTIDEKIVSAIHVGERNAYALSQKVPFGFLTAVCTHPEHRDQGYMRRLLADTEAYMHRRGFCYGMLFGSFGMYHALGWSVPGAKRGKLPCKHVVFSLVPDAGMSVRQATSMGIGCSCQSHGGLAQPD